MQRNPKSVCLFLPKRINDLRYIINSNSIFATKQGIVFGTVRPDSAALELRLNCNWQYKCTGFIGFLKSFPAKCFAFLVTGSNLEKIGLRQVYWFILKKKIFHGHICYLHNTSGDSGVTMNTWMHSKNCNFFEFKITTLSIASKKNHLNFCS